MIEEKRVTDQQLEMFQMEMNISELSGSLSQNFIALVDNAFEDLCVHVNKNEPKQTTKYFRLYHLLRQLDQVQDFQDKVECFNRGLLIFSALYDLVQLVEEKNMWFRRDYTFDGLIVNF